MTITSVTQQDILNKRSEEDAWDIVLLHHEDCQACGEMAALLESIQDNYPTVTFSILDITSADVPLFAPPVIPSILALHCGNRIWEALGTFPDSVKLEKTIQDWLVHKVNYDHISGGTSIHEFS